MHLVYLLKVSIIILQLFSYLFLFYFYEFFMELQKLLHNQIKSKIKLLLLDIIVNWTPLIHKMHRYHKLDIGLHFTDFALEPVVFVQVNAQATQPDVNAEPAVWIGRLVWC